MPTVPAAPRAHFRMLALVMACVVSSAAGACSSGAVDGRASVLEGSTASTESVPGPARTTPDGSFGGEGEPDPPSPTTPGAPDGGTGPAGADRWCEGLVAGDGGRVANPALTEVSGLAASRRHPGVIWAHNDSGNETSLFALGTDGADLGRFPLVGINGVDVEDMALVDGVAYLADIGDNDEKRSEVAVYRFTEPDPSSPGPVDAVETLRFRYSDGPQDAEAVLVDPVSGVLVIIAKRFQFALDEDSESLLAAAPATVHVAQPPFSTDGVGVLEPVSTMALDVLDQRAEGRPADGLALQLGLGGLATGADISADGNVIAVRTYETVWLFDRPPGTSVADALAGEPCEAPTRPESQGEAVAIIPVPSSGPGVALVTIGEGVNPAVTVITAGP